MINIEKISFSYNHENTLSNIDINITKGEFVAIIGHNGSGKSTLAKLINGLFQPSSGDVFIKGLSTKNDDTIFDIRKNVGMVFQNPDNQIIASIVEEDVAFGPENLGLSSEEIRRRVDLSLSKVDMIEHKNRPPHILSGGQKQRIAIAGILAIDPEIIIFDESTSMLDPVGKNEVMQQILNLNKEGKTIIMITHFMDEALLADRIIVLEKGIVVGDRSPEQLFTDKVFCKKYNIILPEILEITDELIKAGINIKKFYKDIDILVGDLCQLM